MIQGRIKENHPNKKLRGKKVELSGKPSIYMGKKKRY